MEGMMARKRQKGKKLLYIMDQDLDVTCRFLFPLAYTLVLAIFAAIVPEQPAVAEFLQAGC